MLYILYLWYIPNILSMGATLWPYIEILYLIVNATVIFTFMVTFLCNVLFCSCLILCLEITT